jgi:hypothetical protein
MAEIVSNIDKRQIFLYANGTDAPAKLAELKNVLKELPKGIQNVFSGLGLVLVGTTAYTAPEGESLKTALHGLYSLHPLGAVHVLFTEGTKMKGGQWTKPEYLTSIGIAGLFLGAEALSTLAAARSIGIVPALARSAITPFVPLVHLGRGSVNIARTVSAVRGGALGAATTKAAEYTQ